MADPQWSHPTPGDASASADGDARIEQLLVSGLDQYFAGDFESAINLWTRVLFLDRHHDRARAYIERARSAQSERQRQTEALVHQGLEAFDRGDVDRARGLLSDALDRGASHDLTLGVLGRIERLDAASGRSTVPPRASSRARVPPPGRAGLAGVPEPLTAFRFWMTTAVLLVVLAASSWWLWTTSSWQALWPARVAAGRVAAIPEVNGPLPIPSVSEAYIRRGQELFESGRLRDALAAFDRVPAGDPLRASADEMRAQIQRTLLSLALSDAASAPPAVAPGARPE